MAAGKSGKWADMWGFPAAIWLNLPKPPRPLQITRAWSFLVVSPTSSLTHPGRPCASRCPPAIHPPRPPWMSLRPHCRPPAARVPGGRRAHMMCLAWLKLPSRPLASQPPPSPSPNCKGTHWFAAVLPRNRKSWSSSPSQVNDQQPEDGRRPMAPALAILCVEEAPPPDPPASATPPSDPPAPAAAAAARVHDSLLEWWSRLATCCCLLECWS
ncbi:hypothetical protein PVAP13_8KG276101 [Panicum virgatum]|uniref:Uncharacterized protein n=1 Tax=Panicum virgatum TaxID=38727 RepID=A0A8T0PUN6_PANVG|nr:hypothetical protein PVAP13_8KG276101 [Panicum virgatum]